MFLQFINHASCVYSNGKKNLLTDPWYSGAVFDGGWKLFIENNKIEIKSLLKKIDFIWYSHEHPDHFSINFLNNFEKEIKERNIFFLFQKTKDQRVADFLQKKKFNLIELNDNKKFQIDNNFDIKIQKLDFYDSAIVANIEGIKIFNLNDCPLKSEAEIKLFKKNYGTCDFLLTQFSYAAWKGGRSNKNWRVRAAKEKLETLVMQSNILKAKYVIPFASFIYFSDRFNFYLNDSVNKPDDLLKIKKKLNSELLLLKPFEKVDLKNPIKNYNGYKFWKKIYRQLNIKTSFDKKKIKYSEDDLYKNFQIYINRLKKNNSFFFIKFISKLKFLKTFQPIIIKLKDLNKVFYIDLANESFKTSFEKEDIEMNARSLILIFREDFGFDTLTVNGCFEEKKNGAFIKMAKSFALGNLNNLGIRLNVFVIFNFNVIILFLKKLFYVKNKVGYDLIKNIE
jgi:UDP-MurNAc hydroxylase